MDGFEEKKWFVYLGDHHEGPFSLADIRGMLSSGQSSQTSYVWAEGMPDWKVMTEVTAFQGILSAPVTEAQVEAPESSTAMIPEEPSLPTGPRTLAAFPSATAPASSTTVEQPVTLEAKADAVQEKEITTDVHPQIQLQLQRSPTMVSAVSSAASDQLKGVEGLDFNVASGAQDEKLPHKKRGGILKYVLLLFAMIGGVVAYYQAQDSDSPMAKQFMDQVNPILLQATEVVPALGTWISPIPALEDVSVEEYKELRAAAMAGLENGAPKIAVAHSTADPTSPAFYVASNLPEGAVIDLFIEGTPESLLNQLSFSTRTQVVISKKFGKSVAVKYPDGKSIPRGKYTIYAVEGETQPAAVAAILSKLQPATAKVAPSVTKGFKLLATREYFLGGNKDANYLARLKEYHDKIREKAQLELAELKQFAVTLESNFHSTQTNYASISKQKNPALRKKQWIGFHTQWKSFAEQFVLFFANKPASTLATDFFYGTVYQAVDQVFHAIQDVHSVQNNFILGQGDKNTIDIQLGQSIAVAGGSLAALKAKIEQIEKMQPGPGGLPRKDGL